MSEPKTSCTARQQEAIDHTVGPACVLAGPGSGKTFVTTRRIHRLITQEGVEPSQILVITFTKAAALEMQERFFLLMGERPPVYFGTFHALFYYILRQSARYRGYTIITETEKRKLIREILQMHGQFGLLQEEDIEELLGAISRQKTVTGEEAIQLRKLSAADFQIFMKEYQEYLASFEKFDFDDLMNACLMLLREDSGCLSKWQAQFAYILIDEFQDISPVQYEIMKLLAAPQDNLFIVGDDDQSIYGFRGATPDSVQRFLADYENAKQILLDVNFRCHKEIVAAAGAVIRENGNRLPKEILASHEEGEGTFFWKKEGEEDVGAAVSQALQEEQQAGRLGDCALICRRNFDCGMWAQTLQGAQIPYALQEKPKDRFAHFVIRDIRAYLALGQGELLRRHFLRIMNRPLRYFKRESMPEEQVSWEELLSYYQGNDRLKERVRRMRREVEGLFRMRLPLQIHYIRKAMRYEAWLQEKYGSERAKELARVGEEFEEFSRQFVSLREMNDYISQYREVIKNPKTDENGVKILTMHASKGLEFPIVYLPDCNEGKIPLDKSVTPEQIEEERRMFYVAMTRAKRKLCLFCYKGKTGRDAPSRFLKPLQRFFRDEEER